jgi:DNA-binding transcriptional MocR family regulator
MTKGLLTQKSESRQEQVVGFVKKLIENDTYGTGERIPSVREMSRRLGTSITTVVEAYGDLESEGFLEARPRSGYYVRSRTRWEPSPRKDDLDLTPTDVHVMALWQRIRQDSQRNGLIQLGSGIPDYGLFPAEKLGLCHARILRRPGSRTIEYDTPEGSLLLRTQIAKRAVAGGCTLSPDEITVTAGCSGAITFALRVICRPGDVVAIESPTFFVFLQALEKLGLRALEIPAHPADGINVEVLRYALQQTKIAACLVVPSFSYPLGSCMPLENRRELVSLLAEHQIPLIEDDTFGELWHGKDRPRSLKSFDREGLVLHCSSVSKTLAPGYRVGWIAAGRYQAEIESIKYFSTLSCAVSAQEAVAEFIINGDYDRHLRTFRATLVRRVATMCAAVERSFPQGTRVWRPQGGYLIWVELPAGVDALVLYQCALHEGIMISPGPLYSASARYKNHLMFNGTYTSDLALAAVHGVGKIAHRLAEKDDK